MKIKFLYVKSPTMILHKRQEIIIIKTFVGIRQQLCQSSGKFASELKESINDINDNVQSPRYPFSNLNLT